MYTVVLAYFIYHPLLGNPGEGGELYADALFSGSYVGTALCGIWSLAVEELCCVPEVTVVTQWQAASERAP